MEVRIHTEEFEAFRELIHDVAGIALGDQKRALLCSRLSKRLRHFEFSSFQQYYDHLCHDDPSGDERRRMINCITTNKTNFFREPHHFEFLRDSVLANLSRPGAPRKLRIWSAGCSTGEEPYSIAVTLAEHLSPLAGWDIKILASDIDTDVLAHAEAGVYTRDKSDDIPDSLQRKWFERAGASSVRVRRPLRDLIAFRQINLIEESWPIRTTFDVIFCRNVTIYFDRPTQERLYERLAKHLTPGGYLIAGHSENLHWLDHLFAPVGNTVYRVRPEAASRYVAPRAAPVLATTRIQSGGVFASREPAIVTTLLGSCVSACLFDPVAGVGGMNHFMLPDGTNDGLSPAACYGVHAMELLINRLMKLGGDRSRLQAKVFGAAHVLATDATAIPDTNAAFILEFCAKEGIPIVARRLGGDLPLHLTLFTHTGKVQIRVVGEARAQITEQDRRYRSEVQRATESPDRVTLF